MTQVRITEISGGTYPINVYIADVYGNNQSLLGTIATGTTVPSGAQSAGRVRITPATPRPIAAFDGLRFLSNLVQILFPGTALSREKAKSILEPAVTQDIPQKN